MTLRFDLRGLIPNSLLEWENRVACVAIAGGCTLRCPYCHSWRYVTGLSGLAPLDAEEVFALLRRQRGWIGGVVFTGGEPTLQPGLCEFAVRVKTEFGVRVKVHTNGSNPDVLEKLLRRGALDCLALDYKAPPDERFLAAAGAVPANTAADAAANAKLLDRVKKTFALAAAAGDLEREYHTTLCPAFIGEATFADMAAALEPGGTWFLQQYENRDCLNPAAAGTRRFTNSELDAFAAVAGKTHEAVLLKRGTNA